MAAHCGRPGTLQWPHTALHANCPPDSTPAARERPGHSHTDRHVANNTISQLPFHPAMPPAQLCSEDPLQHQAMYRALQQATCDNRSSLLLTTTTRVKLLLPNHHWHPYRPATTLPQPPAAHLLKQAEGSNKWSAVCTSVLRARAAVAQHGRRPAVLQLMPQAQAGRNDDDSIPCTSLPTPNSHSSSGIGSGPSQSRAKRYAEEALVTADHNRAKRVQKCSTQGKRLNERSCHTLGAIIIRSDLGGRPSRRQLHHCTARALCEVLFHAGDVQAQDSAQSELHGPDGSTPSLHSGPSNKQDMHAERGDQHTPTCTTIRLCQYTHPTVSVLHATTSERRAEGER